MKRFIVSAAAAALVLAGAPARAQGGGQDFSKVEIKTTKVAGNLSVLEGVGGNIGGKISVLTGPDGAFLVDAAFAPLTEKILAAVKAIQPDGRVRFVVNTHLHGDHTGGNANLAKAGATLLARVQRADIAALRAEVAALREERAAIAARQEERAER